MNSNIEKDLKEQKLDSVYLLYGKETYLLENALRKIKKLFGELKEGLNYIKIDGTNVESLIAELQTPPFGFEKKIIIVKDTELLKKQGKKKNQFLSEQVEKLALYIDENIEDIKLQNVLIFIEEDIDKNALYEIIKKYGTIGDFEPEKVPEITNRIKFICNSYNVKIDNYMISYFIECCGTSLQDLMNEIRKLIEYAGNGGSISKDDIDVLCIRQLDSVIFDLTDSLGQKNVTKALEVLKNLIYAKEPVQKILVTLYNHFKKLYIVKLCEAYKQDIMLNLSLKPNQTFLVSKYKRQAGYFSEVALRRILKEFIKLDEDYKNGNVDLNLGLETVLCGYCS